MKSIILIMMFLFASLSYSQISYIDTSLTGKQVIKNVGIQNTTHTGSLPVRVTGIVPLSIIVNLDTMQTRAADTVKVKVLDTAFVKNIDTLFYSKVVSYDTLKTIITDTVFVKVVDTLFYTKVVSYDTLKVKVVLADTMNIGCLSKAVILVDSTLTSLGSARIKKVTVMNYDSCIVYIGGSTLTEANGYPLAYMDSYTLEVNNLNRVYLWTVKNNAKVRAIYFY